MSKLKFFIDFDGTITQTDVVDAILERFGQSEWTQVEKEWIAGKIGSRECLARQMALVTVSRTELAEFLAEIEIDPFFVKFLRRAKELSIPVVVVSDGFKIVIDEIFKRRMKEEIQWLENLPVFSNDLTWVGNNVKAIFGEGPLCEHRCANCKPGVIKKMSSEEDQVIFVGDGLSDRFAAKASTLTFAKGKLLQFCQENEIVHKSYSSFKDIEEWLTHVISRPEAVTAVNGLRP